MEVEKDLTALKNLLMKKKEKKKQQNKENQVFRNEDRNEVVRI
jgi:uncharacterized membrane protein YgaE (UPF0421/DUF939 family)